MRYFDKLLEANPPRAFGLEGHSFMKRSLPRFSEKLQAIACIPIMVHNLSIVNQVQIYA